MARTSLSPASDLAVGNVQETISYLMPAFKQHGILVYFAAWKHHIALYPAPRGTAAFAKDLAMYGDGKSTMRFPMDQPIPYELVTRIVSFRLRELQATSATSGPGN